MSDQDIATVIAHLEEQISNLSDDVKEIKTMLTDITGQVNMQRTDVAVSKTDIDNLKAFSKTCSAGNAMEINDLTKRVNAVEQISANVSDKVRNYIKYTQEDNDKSQHNLAIIIPVVVATVTFTIDIIMRFAHL